MKGLICSILKAKDFPDCSCNGISSRFSQVTLCGPDIEGIFEPLPDAPEVRLVKRNLYRDEIYVHARPVEIPAGTHSAMGGCFIWSCDARFPARQPIPLHDRVERSHNPCNPTTR